MSVRFRLLLLCAVAPLPLMLSPAVAAAQQALAADGASEAASSVAEVVVTATKAGPTLLSRTAVSANVLGAEALAERRIASVSDLQTQVPGLIADAGSSTPKVAVRGVGHDQFGLGAENGVTTYIDGVLVGRTNGLLSPYNDLERVEVLKGPQGTSFGRNAVGGAINYITQKPRPGFEGFVNAQYGAFDRRRLGGALNYGGDAFGVRLSGYRQRDDGYAHNVTTGKRGEGGRQYALRGVFEARPTANLQLRYLFDQADEALDGPAQIIVSDPAASVVTLFADQLRHINAPVPDRVVVGMNNNYEFSNSLEPRQNTRLTTHALTTTLDLGKVSLRSITAFQKTDYRVTLDSDQSALTLLETPSTRYQGEQFTQELVSVIDAGALNLTLGGFYLWQRATSDATIDFFSTVNPTGGVLDLNTDQTTKSYAAFAEARYSVSDRIRATAGLRYTKDRKDVDLLTRFTTSPISPVQATFTTCDQTFSDSWSKLTFNAGVEADLSSGAFAYSKVSRGFKAGGLNDSGCPNGFGPETLTSYETGMKGRWLDGRLRYALSAFYSRYDDIQVSVIRGAAGGSTASLTENAAKATVWGLDVQGAYEAGHGVSFDLAGSWMPRAAYDRYVSVDPFNPAAGAQDLSGARLNRAPKLTATAGVNLRATLAKAYPLTLRGELYHTSQIAYSQFGYASALEDAYTLLNAYASVGLTEKITVRLTGKNLAGKHYMSGRVPNGTVNHVFGYFGRPREIGGEITVKF